MQRGSFSIITPVYNEEEIIRDSVLTNIRTADKFKLDYEVIIINDGSSDKSLEILRKDFSGNSRIKILNKEKNEGFGSAVRSGIELSKNEFIICAPADSPLTEDVLSAFYNAMHKADIIVSYRRERMGYSPMMLFNSFAFHKIVSFLFNMNLRDYNWMHLYNRRIFDEGKIQIEYNGIFMLAEVLIKAKRQDYSFYEVEVIQHQRISGVATASKFSTAIKTFMDIVRFYRNG